MKFEIHIFPKHCCPLRLLEEQWVAEAQCNVVRSTSGPAVVDLFECYSLEDGKQLLIGQAQRGELNIFAVLLAGFVFWHP